MSIHFEIFCQQIDLNQKYKNWTGFEMIWPSDFYLEVLSFFGKILKLFWLRVVVVDSFWIIFLDYQFFYLISHLLLFATPLTCFWVFLLYFSRMKSRLWSLESRPLHEKEVLIFKQFKISLGIRSLEQRFKQSIILYFVWCLPYHICLKIFLAFSTRWWWFSLTPSRNINIDSRHGNTIWHMKYDVWSPVSSFHKSFQNFVLLCFN